MKENKINELPEVLSLKATYEVDDSYDSDRFIKVKIRVMHDGVNYNDSRFFVEGMNKARDSIYNIPILGHVTLDEDGNPQFNGHDFHIEETKDGKKKLIYDELPIGLVPESATYEVIEENGIHYVDTEAYIWKEYSNYAEDIISKNEDIDISMEIIIDAYSYSSSSEIFDITEYRYQGITCLGNGSLPAMESASLTTSFSQRLDEMKLELNEELTKGGNGVSIEDKKEEFAEETNETEELEDNPIDFEGTHDEQETNEVSNDFTMHSELTKNLSVAIEGLDDLENNEFNSLIDFDDNHVFFERRNYDQDWTFLGYTYFRVSYSVGDESSVVLSDNFVQVHRFYLTQEEYDRALNDRNELFELRKKQRKAAVEKIFAKFEEKLSGNKDFEDLKEDNDALSVEAIETKCFEIVGKVFFSTSPTFTNKKEDDESDVVLDYSSESDEENEESKISKRSYQASLEEVYEGL